MSSCHHWILLNENIGLGLSVFDRKPNTYVGSPHLSTLLRQDVESLNAHYFVKTLIVDGEGA